TTDDNVDLSPFHECVSIIERNNFLRAVHRQARRAHSLCWFNNICNSWEM
ncbi:4278_t:CDS:1, partial [Funneliformis geosporum]